MKLPHINRLPNAKPEITASIEINFKVVDIGTCVVCQRDDVFLYAGTIEMSVMHQKHPKTDALPRCGVCFGKVMDDMPKPPTDSAVTWL